MWPISARLAATLTGRHTVVAKADILLDGETVATITGAGEGNTGVTERVGLVDGQVSVRRATVRRTASVTLIDPDNELPPLLVPLRSEVRLWRGAVYADATSAERAAPPADREYVPLITLVVFRPRSGEWPARTVEGPDRLGWVARQKFTTPWIIPPATTITAAVGSILAAKLPGARRSLDLAESGTTTSALSSHILDEDSDPAEACANLVAAAGQVLYCDPMGTIVARAETTTGTTDPVLTLTPGPGSVMLRPVVDRDASDAENAVIATGESTDLSAPARGYWEDSNPASATYAKAVGVIPRRFSSPLLTTNEQATLAATTIGRTQLGIPDTVAQGILANPAVDAGDVVAVSDPDQGLDTVVMVDSYQLGLTASTMVLQCRAAAVVT